MKETVTTDASRAEMAQTTRIAGHPGRGERPRGLGESLRTNPRLVPGGPWIQSSID